MRDLIFVWELLASELWGSVGLGGMGLCGVVFNEIIA